LDQKQDLLEKVKNIDEVKTKLDKFRDSKYALDSGLETLKKEVSFFTKHDNCPTCKQTIDSGFREKTLAEKSSLLTECEIKMTDVLEKLQKTQAYLSKFSAIQDKIAQLTVQIAARMSTISNIEKNILDFEKQKTRLDSKKKEMMDNNDITALETEKELILYEKNKLLHNKQLQQITANMLKDSGIKSLIIKQYVPVINKLINKYLTTMEFFCNFTLDETFNETIKSRYRDDFSYFSFSEGEKRRIDLAILFAWRALAKLRNSASVNLLIFDEVLDSSTDQQGIETFFTLIKEEVEDTNVFVISHVQGAHESKFDRVLNFKKEKNFSIMLEE
jgi:DNA repair exonuclease SbcCD ATPase subunit